MSDALTFRVDDTPMREALAQYVQFSRKTLAEIVDAKVGDWAWQAAKIVHKSSRAAVESFRNQGGRKWYGYIAKLIRQGQGLHLRRKVGSAIGKRRGKGGRLYNVYQRESYTKTVKGVVKKDRHQFTGRFTANDVRGGVFQFGRGTVQTADAARIAKKLIARRVARVGALSAMLLYVAGKFGEGVRRVGHMGAYLGDTTAWGQKRKREYILTGLVEKHANPARPSSGFSMPVGAVSKAKLDGPTGDNDTDTGAGANRRAGYISAAIQRAQGLVVSDMQVYIANKLREEADRVSVSIATGPRL